MGWHGEAGVWGLVSSWCRAKVAGGGVGSVSIEEVAMGRTTLLLLVHTGDSGSGPPSWFPFSRTQYL